MRKRYLAFVALAIIGGFIINDVIYQLTENFTIEKGQQTGLCYGTIQPSQVRAEAGIPIKSSIRYVADVNCTPTNPDTEAPKLIQKTWPYYANRAFYTVMLLGFTGAFWLVMHGNGKVPGLNHGKE